MQEPIYVMRNGATEGPFTRGEIQQRLLSEEFNLDMAAYLEGQSQNPRTLRKIMNIPGSSGLKSPMIHDPEVDKRRAAAAAEINRIAQQEDKKKEREMNRSHGGGMLSGLLIVLILLLAGGGAFYYFNYLKPNQAAYSDDSAPAPNPPANQPPAASSAGAPQSAGATTDGLTAFDDVDDPDSFEVGSGVNLFSRRSIPNVRATGGGIIRRAFVAEFKGQPTIIFSGAALLEGGIPTFSFGSTDVGTDNVSLAFTSEIAVMPAEWNVEQKPLPKAAAPGELTPVTGDTVHVGFQSKSKLEIIEVTPQYLRVQASGVMTPGAPAVLGEGSNARIIGIYESYKSPALYQTISRKTLSQSGKAFIWRVDTPAQWVQYDLTNFAQQQRIVQDVSILTSNLSVLYTANGQPHSVEEMLALAESPGEKNEKFQAALNRLKSQNAERLDPGSRDTLVRSTLGRLIGDMTSDIASAKQQITYGPLQLQLIDEEYVRKGLKENYTAQRSIR